MNLINKDNHLGCTYRACNGTTYSQQNVLQENVCTVGIPKKFWEQKHRLPFHVFISICSSKVSHKQGKATQPIYIYIYICIMNRKRGRGGTHLHRKLQHLHSDCSHVRQWVCGGTAREPARRHGTASPPSRLGRCCWLWVLVLNDCWQ